MRLEDIKAEVERCGMGVELATISELRDRRLALDVVAGHMCSLYGMEQERIDLVETVLAARHGEPAAVEHLEVLRAALPELGLPRRATVTARSVSHRGYLQADAGLVAEIDRLAPAEVPDTDCATLRAELDCLVDHQQRIASLRRRVGEVLEVIETDIARRYRTTVT